MLTIVALDDLHTRAHVARYGVDVDATIDGHDRIEVPKAVESELFTTAVASHATPFTELDAATNTAARFVCHEAVLRRGRLCLGTQYSFVTHEPR